MASGDKLQLTTRIVTLNALSWQMSPVPELCTSTSEEGLWARTRVKYPTVRFDPPHHPGS